MSGSPAALIAQLVKLLTSSTSLSVQDTARALRRLVDAIDECSTTAFDPVAIMQSLLPYFAPVGTRYGDSVPLESAADKHHTVFAGGAITAIASIIRKCGATPLWPTTLQSLINCWPSTCMGLLFYSRALMRKGPPPGMLEVESPAHAFTSIVTLLEMYADIDALAALMRKTPEVTDLIIILWALEAQNTSLSAQLKEMFPDICQPTTVRLMYCHLFSRRDPDSCGALLVSTLKGSPVIAGAGLEHIRRSSSTLSHISALPAVHAMHVNLRNLNYLHSTRLHLLLLSQNSVHTVTGALMALTSCPFDAETADSTADSIILICGYFQKNLTSDGLTYLNQSLDAGLLVGLMRAHPWLAYKKATFDAFMGLVAGHLSKYLIYISVLRQVHKSLTVAQQLGMDALPEVCRQVWLAFETYARVRLKLASNTELETVACNNGECNKAAIIRCSGCWDTVYCSRECQMAAWNEHGETCRARISGRQSGTLPLLGAQDVQFALRVTQHDFEEHKADICTRWSSAGTLPLCAGIDYSVFPHEVNIGVPEVVREQMRSDAAIYAVFPQGMAGKEYYMCDLGLSRGEENTDEETIQAVVEMVGAQPVPAFLPIN
ncbi:hypothetical protein C8R47DRAFT_1162022 [Mycena vitilis]|nr:hypothetical protein C8R47DRAFT_1162022 [Mycena vitilis]